MEEHKATIIKSKRRTIALSITRTGELIVRAPLRTPERLIADILHEKQNWIQKKIQETQLRYIKKVPKSFTEGESFLYLGAHLVLTYSQSSQIEVVGNTLQLPLQLKPIAKQQLERWYIRQANSLILQLVEHTAAQMDIYPISVQLRDMTSRWGSCSSSRLHFCWRLIMAPKEVIKYVVIHELAHIKHPNHSKYFWALVSKFDLEFNTHRSWLHTHGHTLHY